MCRIAGEQNAYAIPQLLEVTEQFDMQTQPQLLLLQKTMVVAEGVARTLNPSLNMWVTAEPVVKGWIERKLGPIGKLEGAANAAASLGAMALSLPEMLGEAQRATQMLAEMSQGGGIRLDKETTRDLAPARSKEDRWQRVALVAGAIALVVIAWTMVN